MTADEAAVLRSLLAALVKLALAPDADPAGGWRAEALEAQRRWAPLAAEVDGPRFDGLWSAAVGTAERDPAVRRGETVNPTLPTMAPVRPDRLVADPFDLEGAIQSIRDAASFG